MDDNDLNITFTWISYAHFLDGQTNPDVDLAGLLLCPPFLATQFLLIWKVW